MFTLNVLAARWRLSSVLVYPPRFMSSPSDHGAKKAALIYSFSLLRMVGCVLSCLIIKRVVLLAYPT